MLTEAKRYERYQAWCQLLGVPAAEFDAWRRESAKIPELQFQFGFYRAENFFSSNPHIVANA